MQSEYGANNPLIIFEASISIFGIQLILRDLKQTCHCSKSLFYL
uniref:Uncharacterized protein n=1 Tax=Arundo donax TaxID=35708 RepID=A0A0A9D6M9_ARUDO